METTKSKGFRSRTFSQKPSIPYHNIEGFIIQLIALDKHERSEVLRGLFSSGRLNLKDKNGCTLLHFAVTFGCIDICLELLEAGASTQETNNAQQTPSALAASYQHFECATLINNFVSAQEVRQFIQPFCAPYWVVPFKWANVFHRLVSDANLHPIRIAFDMRKLGSPSLLEATHNSLVLMRQREAREFGICEPKRVLKIHYLTWLVGKFREKSLDLSRTTISVTNAPLAFTTEYASKRIEERTPFIFKMIESAMSSLRGTPSRFVSYILERLELNPQNPLGVLHSIINDRPVNYKTYQACHFCQKENAWLPCEECGRKFYCDPYCLNYDRQSHQYNCHPYLYIQPTSD